jgi:hypothetical protein
MNTRRNESINISSLVGNSHILYPSRQRQRQHNSQTITTNSSSIYTTYVIVVELKDYMQTKQAIFLAMN